MKSKKIGLEKFARELYRGFKPDVSLRTLSDYQMSARHFERWNGKTSINQLSEEKVREFLLFRSDQKLSPQTVNRDRCQLLALWQTASEFGYHKSPPKRNLIKKLKTPKKLPTSWSVEEIKRLLEACDSIVPSFGWSGNHWKALILTIYDTSHRISCLLSVERDQVEDGYLTVYSDSTKQNADMVHRLHPQTLEAIQDMPEHRLLFPWPLSQRWIWVKFKNLLELAGLPATSRDMFHKIRRTSYTQVYKEKGIGLATKHAGHSCDLSRFYLDPKQIPTEHAADFIERPGGESALTNKSKTSQPIPVKPTQATVPIPPTPTIIAPPTVAPKAGHSVAMSEFSFTFDTDGG